MIYKNSYKERNTISITSETKCEIYLKSKNISYIYFGWNNEIKDKMQIGKGYFYLDYRLQKQPDFLIKSKTNSKFYFLECKSFDKNDYLRLKDCDLKGYKYWNFFIDVYLFIYSFKKNIHKIIELNKLIEISKDCETELMPDNKEPYKLIHLNKLNYD
tara:strand:+ start:1783 stop:2256 length:474 start_codon:yes stop_codon:yes gene_type:complete